MAFIGKSFGLLALTFLLLPACQSQYAGIKEVTPAYSEVVDAPAERVLLGAQNAARELNFTNITASDTDTDGNITGRTGNDHLARVHVMQSGDDVSSVTVHVDHENEAAATQLLGLIKKYAHQSQQAGATESPADYPGVYSQTFSAASDRVVEAARKSAGEMNLTGVVTTAGKADGRVTGQTAENQRVTIDIQPVGQEASRVNVHVGDSGDQVVSMHMLEMIKSNLH